MIKNFTPATYENIIEYDLVFDDGHHNGFAFPCDENGKLLPSVPTEAVKNYHFCLDNPDRFVRFNKVVKTEHRARNNARGVCSCGNEVELFDMYYGACQCDKCGQWYNLFGQTLLPPEQWEDNPEENY